MDPMPSSDPSVRSRSVPLVPELGRTGELLVLLTVAWLACWLLLGLAVGRPTVLLEPAPPEGLRILYVVLLYLSVLGCTWSCWTRRGPGPSAAGLQPARLGGFAAGLAFGVGGAVLHRVLLAGFGAWTPPDTSLQVWLLALATAPLLALAEEVLFRGYLFQVLREDLGRDGAYLLANLFFAAVHMFRPGGAAFKLAYGFGLFLAGVILCRLTETSRSLWPAIGLHTGWILLMVGDPPGRVTPSLFAGLEGDPAAGLLGWLLLLGLLPWVSRGR